MADPVYTRFKIVGGNSSDCTQAASDPAKDPCKIDVFETNLDESFVLERSGDRFSVAAADKAKVARLFPSYSPPARQIGEYLLVRSEFFKLAHIRTCGDQSRLVPAKSDRLQKKFIDEPIGRILGSTVVTAKGEVERHDKSLIEEEAIVCLL